MRKWIVAGVLGAIAACSPASRSTRTAAVPAAPPTTGLRCADPDADGEPDPAPDLGSSGDPGADQADFDLAPARQAEVEGPGGLRVVVRWHGLTGTTHVADELTFTTAGGTLRFAPPAPPPETEASNDEAPPEYPLIEQILVAGPRRWVALGWTSYGEGMQTEHAWLIEDRHGPKILDRLAWTTDRSHGGFAVDSIASHVRIGIPLPQPPDQDGETGIHEGTGWELVHGKQRLPREDVARLPSSDTHVMALRGYYTPPFQTEPSLRHWSGTFVWFSAAATFLLEAPGTGARPSRRR